MQFSVFAQQLQTLEEISSRIEITKILAVLFSDLEVEEIPLACYLLLGQLLPNYESLEFQIAVKTVIKALARCLPEEKIATDSSLFSEPDFSKAETEIASRYKKIGDLGTVAQAILPIKVKKTVALIEVYKALWELAMDNGEGSQLRKLDGLVALLKQLDSLSAKFVIRIILGRLRLGFSTMTVLDALSWAKTGDKSESELLEDAFDKRSDLGRLAQVYLSHKTVAERAKALAQIQVEVGVPVMPALCQRLNSAQEIIDKMTKVFAEPKYDGLRCQIHISKQQSLSKTHDQHIKTFTRSLDDNSHMFPELTEVLKTVNCKSCILDSEAIGYSPETGKLLPFQETITRKRKHEIAETMAGVPIRFYVFDVLNLNGKSLINEKLQDRKELLKNLFKDNEQISHAPYIVTDDPKELHEFHSQQLAKGLEGAVIKQVTSPYQSGRKGWNWVKIKEAEGTRGKLKDTLDCVVMGYYAGRGKRTQFGIGAFLVGVLDQDQNLKTIAKIGTGLSDEQFRDLYERCKSLIVNTMPDSYEVTKSLQADVWVKPGLVVEVAADELTKSPNHSAGLALRFPRLVKFRDDKTWEQATTLNELAAIA